MEACYPVLTFSEPCIQGVYPKRERGTRQQGSMKVYKEKLPPSPSSSVTFLLPALCREAYPLGSGKHSTSHNLILHHDLLQNGHTLLHASVSAHAGDQSVTVLACIVEEPQVQYQDFLDRSCTMTSCIRATTSLGPMY